jgi:hypothetical protein
MRAKAKVRATKGEFHTDSGSPAHVRVTFAGDACSTVGEAVNVGAPVTMATHHANKTTENSMLI